MQDYYTQIYGSPNFDPFFGNTYGPVQQAAVQQGPSAAEQVLGQAGNVAGKIGGRYLGQQVGQAIMGPTTQTVATPQILGAQRLGEAAATSQAPAAASGLPFYANPALAGPATVAAMGAGIYNYGGRQILDGNGTAGNATDVFLQSNPMTAAINPVLDVLGLGTVGDYGEKLWGSGKDKYQQSRDKWRNILGDYGLYGEDKIYTNPDGTEFNFGNSRNDTENQIALADGTMGDVAYDLNFDGLGGYAAGATSPLVQMLTNGASLQGENAAGTPEALLINATLAGADSEEEINQNLKAMYDRLGITQQDAFAANQNLAQAGLIDQSTQEAYNNAVNQAFGQEFYGNLSANAAAPQGGGAALPSIYPQGFDPSTLYGGASYGNTAPQQQPLFGPTPELATTPMGMQVSMNDLGLTEGQMSEDVMQAIQQAYAQGAQLR